MVMPIITGGFLGVSADGSTFWVEICCGIKLLNILNTKSKSFVSAS